MKKSIIFILLIVIVAIVGIVIYSKNNSDSNNISYSTIKLLSEIKAKTNIINSYQDFTKFVKQNSVGDVTKDYKKYSPLEIYNEEFFATKELVFLQVYQDDSKDYIAQIEKVEYNEGKTEATVYYSNTGTYSGTMGKSWQYTFFIEMDNTITNINFVLDNGSKE